MKVLCLHDIPEKGLVKIQSSGIDVSVLQKRTLKKEDIISALKQSNYDGVISLLTDKIDKDVIFEMKASGVKIIANYAVGFNNIDIETAKENEIIVTNTPGVLTDSVAEHTVALILAVFKRVLEGDHLIRSGKFLGWEPKLLLGEDLKDKVLGILGAGRIGTRVAEILKGFGMSVIYFDANKNENIETKLSAQKCANPESLFSRADVISVHLPLNDSTHHFVNKQRLSCMKNTAIIVNTSRGPVVDEEVLKNALENKKIFGAGLDVFENEPKLTEGLEFLNNVVLTPHTASATFSTRNNMSLIVAENIISVLGGGSPINRVN